MRFLSPALVLLVLAFPLLGQEFDDCDANFIAFIGSSAYQFSPNHPGELGTVRLFSILSYQRAAHEKRYGFAVWQVRIDRVEDGSRVMSTGGRAFIGRDGAAVAEFYWDGRDDTGQLVPAGKYRYTFVARYLGDRIARLATRTAAARSRLPTSTTTCATPRDSTTGSSTSTTTSSTTRWTRTSRRRPR